MDITESTKWRDAHRKKGKAVEDQLGHLQETHRLAIHCFENEDRILLYPTHTLSCLRNNDICVKEGAETLHKSQAAIVSMTHIPRQGSHKSIIPYKMSPYGETVAYLFDLDENKPAPARVIRAFMSDVITGENNYGKSLLLEKDTGVAELDQFYRRYRRKHVFDGTEKNEARLIQDVWKDPALSGMQLDALGKAFEAQKGSDILDINEILTIPATRHIAAIAVPLMHDASKATRAISRATAQLNGALSGLEHAEHGLELPVVYYHVSEPYQGKCTYLAQGKEECTAVALAAIDKLQKDPLFKDYNTHCNADQRRTIERAKKNAERLLGVDMNIPLKEQNITLPAGQKR